MRYYLDEDLSYKIAVIAQRRGLDIVSAHVWGHSGVDDEHVLVLAAEDDRCVVTQNYRDFVRLSRQFEERGLPQAGVILVPRSVPANDFAAGAAALVHFDRKHPDGLGPYTVVWLKRAPDDD